MSPVALSVSARLYINLLLLVLCRMDHQLNEGDLSVGTTEVIDEGLDAWFIIPCPSSVKLTMVEKERGTHGSIYALWEVDCRSPVWIGQSIPALVRSVNEKAVWTIEKRLHASSLYRCLRGEARKLSHKSWRVEKYSRSELNALNTRIRGFPSAVYVSKSPEMWQCVPPETPPPLDEGPDDVVGHTPKDESDGDGCGDEKTKQD